MAEQDVWHTRGCQCQRRTQNLICVNLTKTFLNANLHFNQTSMHSEVLNFGQYIWICFYFNPTTFLLLLLLFVFLIVSCVCKNLHFDFMIIYLASKKKKKTHTPNLSNSQKLIVWCWGHVSPQQTQTGACTWLLEIVNGTENGNTSWQDTLGLCQGSSPFIT